MEGTVNLIVALGPVACGPLAEVLMPYSREGPTVVTGLFRVLTGC